MKDEIKLWKEKTKGLFHILEYKKFWDYITNLQEELKYQKEAELEYNEKHTELMNMYSGLKAENKRLKSDLECYENGVYFSSENDKLQEENEHLITQLNTYENTIKEVNKECNSLFNHLTKKDLDYKSRNEKALYFIDMDKHISTNWDNLTNKEKDEFILSLLIELENILQGENKE